MNLKWRHVGVVIILCTGCVTVSMTLTANNPSADDFWRGVVGGLFGGVAGAGVSRALRRRSKI